MNLAFDLQYLRAYSPLLRRILTPFSKTILDLSYVNFLQSDSRPERSLKTIGPVLGTHVYAVSARTHRFDSLQALSHYCAEDTTNTLLALAALTGRILQDREGDKLSPFCLTFYSDLIWCTVAMTEAGVPLSRPALLSLHSRLSRYSAWLAAQCSTHGIVLKGEGPQKSQLAFLDRLSHAAQEEDPAILDNPLLQYTPALKRLSLSESNRDLLCSRLSPSHPLREASSRWSSFVHSEKLLSTWLHPLLFGARRAKKSGRNRSSVIVPQPGHPLPPSPWSPPCESSVSLPPSSSSSASAPSSPPSDSPSPSSLSPLSFSPLSPSSTSTAGAPTSLPTSPSTIRTRSRTATARTNSSVWLSHPSWFIVPSPFKDGDGSTGGTKQGRVTCKDLAHVTDPPIVQSCYASRWHDGFLLTADLSQIELRVPALLSGDPTYVDAFTRGLDMHTATARLLWQDTELFTKYPSLQGVDPGRWKKVCPAFDTLERQAGKRCNFGRGYRAGAATLQRSVYADTGILIPLPIFERFVRSMSVDTPVLYAWQESLIASARRDGRLILPLTGQSRSFMGGTNYDVNEILNFPIQTTAGNVLIRLQAILHRLLSRHIPHNICIFLNVYDALRLDCRTAAYASLARAKLREAIHLCSTQDYWHHLQLLHQRRIPLTMDFKLRGPFP